MYSFGFNRKLNPLFSIEAKIFPIYYVDFSYLTCLNSDLKNNCEIIQAKESPISDKQKWKTGPEMSGGWRKISYSLNNSLFLTAHHSSENLTIEEEGKIFHVKCN